MLRVINFQPNYDRQEGREDRRKDGKERGGGRSVGRGRWMSPPILEVYRWPLTLTTPHVTLSAVAPVL